MSLENYEAILKSMLVLLKVMYVLSRRIMKRNYPTNYVLGREC